MKHAVLVSAVFLLVLGSERTGSVVHAQTGAVPAPADIAATVDHQTVTIQWIPSAPDATYVLEAGSAAGLADVATYETHVGATSFVTSGVAPGIYHVRVRARTATGLSAPSRDEMVIVAPPCSHAPPAPVAIGGTVAGNVVTLEWRPHAACAATSYVIEVGSRSGLSDTVVFDTGTPATRLHVSAAASTYFVRVRTRNAHGVSAVSPEAVVRVGATPSAGATPVPAPKPAPAPPPTAETPGGSGGTFRVLTWNIHHGRTKAGKYDPAAQAHFIANQNPHVVLLQEVQTWDENQPARFKALLEQYTGVAWREQWAPVNGRAGTEGNMVLTRLPVVSSSAKQLHATGDHDAMYSNRSVAHTTVRVGGVSVHLFSTHLDWYNTSHRTAQLLDMMEWTRGFGARRIVGGDFNSWWGEYWIITMMADYYDTWLDITGSKDNGYTVNNAVRFDYLFRAKEGGSNIRPQRIMAPSTTLSDHNPVIADYIVTP
jgi:endonuclease/exonuclease/phosphatase family metal-dependent hydrolase